MNPRRSLQALLVYTVLATVMFTLVVSDAIPVLIAGEGFIDLITSLVLFAITARSAWVCYHEVWRNFDGADTRAKKS